MPIVARDWTNEDRNLLPARRKDGIDEIAASLFGEILIGSTVATPDTHPGGVQFHDLCVIERLRLFSTQRRFVVPAIK